MIKIIPFNTHCENCNVRLTYEQSDIKIEKISYEVYYNVYEDYEYKYIVCPNCNKKIYLD